MVVKTAPTSTTNITGFLTIERGFNLRNESKIARERMALSASGFFLIWASGSMVTSENLSCVHQQMFENRPETQRREKRQGPYDQNGRDQQTCEQPARYRKGSG